MKTRSFLALMLAAACALPLAATAKNFPKGSPAFITDYAKLVAQQKVTGKPAILIFSADWCPPCVAMKQTIYPASVVQPYHDKFLWAYLDADDPANQSAARSYGVQALPHLAFLDEAGKPLGYLMGAERPQDFAKVLQTVLREVQSARKAGGATSS